MTTNTMTDESLQAFNQAVALANTGQKEQAQLLLARLAADNPTSSQVWLWYAFTQSDLAKAEWALNRVQQLEPANPDLRHAYNWVASEKLKQPIDKPSFQTIYTQQTLASERPRLISQPTKKHWSFELNGQTHNVEISVNSFTGKAQVYVNRYEVLVTSSSNNAMVHLGLPIEYQFQVGNHKCSIRTQTRFFSRNQYELIVDDYSLQTQSLVSPLTPLPIWAWLFISLSCLIPILALGGFVPILLGSSSAYISIKISTSKLPVVLRIILCTAVTAVAWLFFITVISAYLKGTRW